MINSKLVKKIIKEISEKYTNVSNIYIKESLDSYGVDVIIDNKTVFDSSSYAEYVFNNTIEDKEIGKVINFLFVEPFEYEYIETLECVFRRNKLPCDVNKLVMDNEFVEINKFHELNIEFDVYSEINSLTMEFDELGIQWIEDIITDEWIDESYKKNIPDVVDTSNLFSLKQGDCSWKIIQTMPKIA